MVKKKNRLVTTSLREIKNSFPRFLSLMIMSFLGVFVYSGLKATAPFMINSLDKYYDERNTYDIKLTSTIGFTSEDVDIVRDVKGIKDIEFSNYADVSFHTPNDKDYVLVVNSVTNDLNYLKTDYDLSTLKDNELLVEEPFLDKTNYKIGDELTLTSDNFVNQTFTIKGVVDSPLYFNNANLNNDRGKTNVGNGTINFYSYTTLNSFKNDYYKNIYLTVDGASKFETNSKKYNQVVQNVMDLIQDKKNEILATRLNYVKTNYDQLVVVNKVVWEYAMGREQVDNYLTKNGFTNDEEFKNYFSNLQESDSNYQSAKKIADTLKLLEENKDNYEQCVSVMNGLGLTKNDLPKYITNLRKTMDNANLLVYNRLNDATYKSYVDDTNSITNLAYVFPLVFYAVAILVSLVSMNRMVEDDRMMLGTFKSLGFSNGMILFKYMLFASIATLVGGIIGVGLGVVIIPSLINSIYRLLFDLPKFYLGLNLKDSLLGFFIALFCICGSTFYTVHKELKAKPAELLRPKSPKAGKKIFLERFTKLWHKIKFSNKITIRNISRYKKRVTVTTLGVAGCCALMLCGFGIRDSITDIPAKQFTYVTTQDATVYFNNVSKSDAKQLLNKDEFTSYSIFNNINATTGKYDIYIAVLSENFEEFQHFYDVKTKEQCELNNDEIFISDKLAQLLNVKKGDYVEFSSEDDTYKMQVGAVIENYIHHYIYMNEQTYNKYSSKELTFNMAYVKFNNLSKEQQLDLQAKMLENADVLNMTFVQDSIDQANDMLQTLNKVVVILIVLAAMLSFIVLYNLSNINIQERKREIATLKVLGFYPNEVNRYITQENWILTFFGVLIGLVAGFFLTNIVVSTVEIEYVRFIHIIKPLSFLYSSIMSFVFTYIINFITHFSLKKIDMIESLKSVE